MKKLTKLLVLSGLVVSLLVGCNNKSGGNNNGNNSSQAAKSLTSIRVAANPTKTSYNVGDAFDPAGLQVKAVYNTGEEDLSANDYQLSGFDSNTAGLKTVTVSYGGKTTTFEVNVVGALSVEEAPEKRHYRKGEELDLTGLELALVDADGEEIKAIDLDDVQVSGFDKDALGPQTVTLTYAGETATFGVEVFAADWSEDEEEAIKNYLIHDIPYYPGFELGDDEYEDPTSHKKAEWFTATTSYVANFDDLALYVQDIASIKKEVEDQENPGQTKLVSAWGRYNGGRVTADAAVLGFVGNAYQFARWYSDSENYFAYQVMTVGFNADGNLLNCVTVASAPLSAYGLGDGASWPAIYAAENYDMVAGDFTMYLNYSVEQTYSSKHFSSMSSAPVQSIEYPDYDGSTKLWVSSNAYKNPYVFGSLYSELYDASVITYWFDNGEESPYTNDDLDDIKAAYTPSASLVITDAEEENDHSFKVTFLHGGLKFFVEYSIDASDNSLQMDFSTEYTFTFRGDYILCDIYDELSLYNANPQTGAPASYNYYFYLDLGQEGDPSLYGAYMVSSYYGFDQCLNYNGSQNSFKPYTLYAAFSSLDDLIDDINGAIDSAYWADEEDIEWEISYSAQGSIAIGEGDPTPVGLSLIRDDYIVDLFLAQMPDEEAFAFECTYNQTEFTCFVLPTMGRILAYAGFDPINNPQAQPLMFSAGEDVEEGDYAGTWTAQVQTGPETVSAMTFVIGEFQLNSCYTTVLVENDDYAGSVLSVSISQVNKTLFAVSFTCYDGVNTPVATWAAAKEAAEGLMPVGADPLPTEFGGNATSFVVDRFNGGMYIIFADAEAGNAYDYDAALKAAGFVDFVGYTYNGKDYYVSPNGQYGLAVSSLEKGKVLRIDLLDEEPELFEDFLDEFEDEFFALPEFDFDDGAKTVDTQILAIFGMGIASISVQYASAEAAAAKVTAFGAALVADGFELGEDGYYSKELTGGYVAMAVVVASDDKVVYMFTVMPPEEDDDDDEPAEPAEPADPAADQGNE